MLSWVRSATSAPKRTRITDDGEEQQPQDRRDPRVAGSGDPGDPAVEYFGVLAVLSSGIRSLVPDPNGLRDWPGAAVYTPATLPKEVPVEAASLLQRIGLLRSEQSRHRHVRIVVISDTHEFHNHVVLPPGDILIHCGDVLTVDKWNPGAVSNYNLRDFFAWFNRQPFALRIVIGGNHDHQMEKLGQARVKAMAAPSVYVEDELLDVCGLRIFGTPRSTPNSSSSGNKAFQLPDLPLGEDRFARSLPDVACKLRPRMRTDEQWTGEWTQDLVPRGSLDDSERLDVLVSHGAPSCIEVREMLRRLRPVVHLCGHVHEMHGGWLVRHCDRGSLEIATPSDVQNSSAWSHGRATLSFCAATTQGRMPFREFLAPPVAFDLQTEHVLGPLPTPVASRHHGSTRTRKRESTAES